MTLDEQIAILQALKEGKKIEARLLSGHPYVIPNWIEWLDSPNFACYEYRIVPEPRRFIIFKWNNYQYASLYKEHVPFDATIICTAIEELTPSPKLVDKFIEDVNKELNKKS